MTDLEKVAESYVDTFRFNRAARKESYLEGYKQCLEDEGKFCEDVQQILSTAYSNLKYKYYLLREAVRYKRNDKAERYKTYLLLKEEFKDKAAY